MEAHGSTGDLGNVRYLFDRLSLRQHLPNLELPTGQICRTRRGVGVANKTFFHIDGDLVEWDYGEYEGRLTVDILEERPDWPAMAVPWRSAQEVAARPDRVVSRLRAVTGEVLSFSSGHFL